MNFKILFLLVSLSLFQSSKSAKILAMFPLAGKSLNILSNKLMVAVVNAGHDVTLISAHKPTENITNGTLRYVHLTGFWEQHKALTEEYDPWNRQEKSNIFASKDLIDLVSKIWDETFKIPEVQQLLHSNESFDAIVMGDLYMDCLKILSNIFNCPLIVFSSTGGNSPFVNSAVGNPLPPSYIPHFYKVGPNFNGMSFFHRVHNFLFYIVDSLLKHYYIFPIHNKILQSNFDSPADITTFYHNILLVLLGSHSSLRQAGPLLPNIVEIGGFHIDPPQKLPKDLQDFLNGAKEGAIYFSLGSHVNSKDMPVAMKNTLLKVFGKLKQRVLWKFEEDLPEKPANVLIQKWLPQTDILAHPNLKLFITHGGYGSILETVYHGVPCLMIPLFFDQYNNAYQAVQNGYALKISFQDQTEETFMSILKELLENPTYRNNAKRIQRLFHDRPIKPIDTAIYWIEYVIRHKGADHLKVVGRTMPWYQFYCIDVIVFLLGFVFAILYLSYFIFRKLFCSRKHLQKQKVH